MYDSIDFSLSASDFRQLVRLAVQGIPQSQRALDVLLERAGEGFPYRESLIAYYAFLRDDASFGRLSRLLNSYVNFGFFLRDGKLQNILTPTSKSDFVHYDDETLTVQALDYLADSTVYLQYFGAATTIRVVASGVREIIVIAPICQHLDLRWNNLQKVRVFGAGDIKSIAAEFNPELKQGAIELFGVDEHFEAMSLQNSVQLYTKCPKFQESIDPEPLIKCLLEIHPELAKNPVIATIRAACTQNENFGFVYHENAVQVILQKHYSLNNSLRFQQEYYEFNADIRDLQGTLFLIYRNRSRFCQIVRTQVENAIVCCPNCYRTLNVSRNEKLRNVWLFYCENVVQLMALDSTAELHNVPADALIVK